MNSKDVAARLGGRRKVHAVQTDEGTLYVRGLTGAERRDYFTEINNRSEQLVSDQKLIVKALCNQDGSPAFSAEEQESGLELVLTWDIVEHVKPVVAKILEASGLEVKSGEEAAKN